MLKSHLFCVKFEITIDDKQTILFDEVYNLVYRTEEWNDKTKFYRTALHINNAIKAICKDLSVNSWNILIKDIYKIHNHLIIDLIMKKGVWIARDKNGTLAIFENKPILDYDDSWYSEYVDEEFSIINRDLFPEITFENSPKQLIIKED